MPARPRYPTNIINGQYATQPVRVDNFVKGYLRRTRTTPLPETSKKLVYPGTTANTWADIEYLGNGTINPASYSGDTLQDLENEIRLFLNIFLGQDINLNSTVAFNVTTANAPNPYTLPTYSAIKNLNAYPSNNVARPVTYSLMNSENAQNESNYKYIQQTCYEDLFALSKLTQTAAKWLHLFTKQVNKINTTSNASTNIRNMPQSQARGLTASSRKRWK